MEQGGTVATEDDGVDIRFTQFLADDTISARFGKDSPVGGQLRGGLTVWMS